MRALPINVEMLGAIGAGYVRAAAVALRCSGRAGGAGVG